MFRCKSVLVAGAILLALAACSPLVRQPVPALPTPTPAGQLTWPPFLLHLRADLATRFEVAPDAIILLEHEPVDWGDACLGIHEQGLMCAQVVTPGYRVLLETPRGNLEVHTDQTGQVYRLAPPAQTPTAASSVPVMWERSGGIAGICLALELQEDATYRLTDCQTGDIVSAGRLSTSDAATLNRWLTTYSPFTWSTTPPAGSADMFVDQVTFDGRGSQAAPSALQEEIDAFLAGVASEARAATATPSPSLRSGTGINGHIQIGPTCPVVRTEDPCPDRPYQATIEVLTPTGERVALLRSDAQGTFGLDLGPGTYVLHPVTTGTYPHAADQTVVVHQGQYTQVTIVFDSGIR